MTHPIDPLTPHYLLARDIYDNANRGDHISFLSVWERVFNDRFLHRECITEEDADRNADRAFRDGQAEGYDMGHDDGYKEGYKDAWEEAKDKIRVITGERLTQDS